MMDQKTLCKGDIFTGLRDDNRNSLRSFSVLAVPTFVIHIKNEILIANAVEDRSKGELYCKFLNPDKNAYPDRIIRNEEILELYHFAALSRRFQHR